MLCSSSCFLSVCLHKAVCLGSNVFILPLPRENEQPKHHGLRLNQTSLHRVFCCVVNSVTCMTERVYSRSCSVLMYIRNPQLNLCTDFALVVPHVIFSALVNKKKGKFIHMWELYYCNCKFSSVRYYLILKITFLALTGVCRSLLWDLFFKKTSKSIWGTAHKVNHGFVY